MLLRFATTPTVAGVDKGSAAETAGLQPGDQLQAINGMKLTTLDGARRFQRTSSQARRCA